MKTKILVVLPSLNLGGAESRMVDILKGIDKNIFAMDFLILSDEDNQYYENVVESLGSRIIKIPSPRKENLIMHFKHIYCSLKKGKYDAVHANTSYHSGIIVFFAWLCGVKVRLVHARTTGLRHQSIKSKAYAQAGKMLIRIFATHRVAISESSARFLFGTAPAEVIPNAIELDRYLVEDEKASNPIKEQFCLSDMIVLGHIGRFDEAKNQKFVIDVYKEFQKNNRSVAIFIGDGDLRLKCEHYSENEINARKIWFVGPQGNVAPWLHCFSVLVFPSIYEGLGNVVIEAQAAGIPCVCSKAIPKEADMGLGLVYWLDLNDDVHKWCNTICDALRTESPLSSVRKKAFESKKYTLEQAITRMCSIYGGK